MKKIIWNYCNWDSSQQMENTTHRKKGKMNPACSEAFASHNEGGRKSCNNVHGALILVELNSPPGCSLHARFANGHVMHVPGVTDDEPPLPFFIITRVSFIFNAISVAWPYALDPQTERTRPLILFIELIGINAEYSRILFARFFSFALRWLSPYPSKERRREGFRSR